MGRGRVLLWGGDGGMCAGGGEVVSSALGPAGATAGGAGWEMETAGARPEGRLGSGGGAGREGSSEWRLLTGVILLGGVGGERLAGAGTTMVALPD